MFQLIKFAANIEFLSDQYLTFLEEVETTAFKEKGSKFFGFCKSVFNEEEILEFIAQIKKRHPKASHYCFAYRLGKDKNNYRAFDDGEPSGTAGLPILGQIDSFGLTNSVIVIVRYYGGTKLGTTGLIKAYKTTAKMTIENSEIISKYWLKPLIIRFSPLGLNPIFEYLKKDKNVEILKTDIGEVCKIEMCIKESEYEGVLQKLRTLQSISIG